ncbi:olfactory receptor 5AP2-like [Elgaria multicarinata webbii]|uniref:olfactory receptor 5AP2-like n=1 Tax=Elgaria multicarinata webbii TaxID=159646 RepID=UPI002FCCF1F3
MWSSEEGNETTIAEFILVGFGNPPELQPLLFLLFLVIYTVTITGNLLIFLVIVIDHHLHTPMYFFLANLSCLETCYSSTILPQMLTNLLTGEKTITFSGCIAQYFFFGSFASIETYLLAAMSYDRYLAICRPLIYASTMQNKLCFQLMAVTWINGMLVNCLITYLLAQLSFCGPNTIDHYFCDFIPLEKLSCTDTSILVLVFFLLTFIFTVTPFLLTLTSYACIIASILKIPSTTGRQKAFSTCSSHLMVVCLFYGTIIIVYMLPDTPTLRDLNKVFSVFYTVLTPLVNPLIYSLRNKEVHRAIRQICGKLTISARNQLTSSLSFQFISKSKF